MSPRRVDQAMAAERPEKVRVRELWTEIVCNRNEENEQSPNSGCLYLTLSGRKGRDISALIERGIISLTESGSIAADSLGKITAVENSPPAVAELQATFPGLKILEQSIGDIVRGNSLIRFPDGEHEDLCRASVINLDTNIPFSALVNENADIFFPAINLIQKFALLHLKEPRRPWTLLLTMHGEIQWQTEVWQYVSNYLSENLQAVEDFSEAARTLWGNEFHNRIIECDGEWAAEQTLWHQKLLLALVPKLIAERMRQHNLELAVDWAYVYGEPGTDRAPMVTWAIAFETAAAALTPNALYQMNLARALSRVGQIEENGEISMLIEL